MNRRERQLIQILDQRARRIIDHLSRLEIPIGNAPCLMPRLAITPLPDQLECRHLRLATNNDRTGVERQLRSEIGSTRSQEKHPRFRMPLMDIGSHLLVGRNGKIDRPKDIDIAVVLTDEGEAILGCRLIEHEIPVTHLQPLTFEKCRHRQLIDVDHIIYDPRTAGRPLRRLKLVQRRRGDECYPHNILPSIYSETYPGRLTKQLPESLLDLPDLHDLDLTSQRIKTL